jgi:hypothetical protein
MEKTESSAKNNIFEEGKLGMAELFINLTIMLSKSIYDKAFSWVNKKYFLNTAQRLKLNCL